MKNSPLHEVPELETRRLTGHTGMFTFVAFSPDSELLASSSWDGTIRIWELPSCSVRHVIKVENTCEDSVVFSPSGSRFAVCSSEDVSVFRVDTGDRVFHYQLDPRLGQQGEWRFLAFPQEDVIVLATQCYIYSFQPDIGCELARIKLDEREIVFDIRCARDNRVLVYTYNSFCDRHIYPMIRVRDLLSGDCLCSLHIGSLARPVVAPDGQMVAIFRRNKLSKIPEVWNLDTGHKICTLDVVLEVDPDSLFSPDGSILALTDRLGKNEYTVSLWETHSGRLIQHLPFDFFVPMIAFSTTQDLLAVVEFSRRQARTTFWNAKTKRLLGKTNGHMVRRRPIFSPNGRWFASAAGQHCMDYDPPEGTIFLTDISLIQ